MRVARIWYDDRCPANPAWAYELHDGAGLADGGPLDVSDYSIRGLRAAAAEVCQRHGDLIVVADVGGEQLEPAARAAGFRVV